MSKAKRNTDEKQPARRKPAGKEEKPAGCKSSGAPKLTGAAARLACAEKFLQAAPKAAEVVCRLATDHEEEWALKLVLATAGAGDAVGQALTDELENQQQEAFISTGFERRLIEDLRRSAGIPEVADESAT